MKPPSAPLVLRAASDADTEAVRSVVFGVLREYGLDPDPGSTDADLVSIEQSYFARGGRFDVLADGDRVVGSVGLYPVGGGMCELRKMYLRREYRGAGWGRRMLEHAIHEARARGFRTLVLETASVLKEAMALYKSAGFKPDCAGPHSCRCDQAWKLEL